MSVRLFLSMIGLCALPVAALADDLVIPGIDPGPSAPRPGYRRAAFPPPQHDIFGQPAEPTGYEPRPSYRQTQKQFPPPGGRYGGGFIEYLLTGGRPEPIAPPYAHQPRVPLIGGLVVGGPDYGGPVYMATASQAAPLPRTALPTSGLPDYTPRQPEASFGAQAVALAPQPMAYNSPQASYDPTAADPSTASRPIDPMYQRQMVDYAGRQRPGTIVIDTPHKFLYLIQPGGHALRYGIGVGRPGFTWAGVKTISRKAEWPAWTPPAQMLRRRPDLPRHMVGGQANPLGARAMYLGSSMYRIHGTNEPYTIGTNVSSGCIRMMNQDVIDLYGRVGVGTHVLVL